MDGRLTGDGTTSPIRSKCLRFGCSDRRSGTKQSRSVETEERESRRKNLLRSSRERLLPSSALFQIDNSLVLQLFANLFPSRNAEISCTEIVQSVQER